VNPGGGGDAVDAAVRWQFCVAAVSGIDQRLLEQVVERRMWQATRHSQSGRRPQHLTHRSDQRVASSG